MASPRITATMRQGIVNNTVSSTFKSEREKIVEREKKLADKVYNEKYTKRQRDLMGELGDEFIARAAAVQVNVDGKRIELWFDGSHGYISHGYIKKTTETRFVDKNNTWHDTPYVVTGKIKDEVDQLISDKADLNDRENQARLQLSAMLETVVSFKKLRAVWPQGEKFYDMYDVDSEKPGVPAIVVTELNKILGLK